MKGPPHPHLPQISFRDLSTLVTMTIGAALCVIGAVNRYQPSMWAGAVLLVPALRPDKFAPLVELLRKTLERFSGPTDKNDDDSKV